MRSATVLVLGLALTLAGCSEPGGRPATVTASPTSPSTPHAPSSGTLQALSGRYELTVTLPDGCAMVPAPAKRRTYDVTLENTAHGYLGLRVIGDGYPTATGVGDVWGSPESLTFKWNWFDIGPCDDGYPERLSETRSMMLCGAGRGGATAEGNIAAVFNGEVRLHDGSSAAPLSCVLADHPFTFTRRQ